MKKLTKLLAVLLIAATLISFAACGTTAPAESTTENTTASATSAASEVTTEPQIFSEPIKLTDQMGRAVTLPQPAQRIVSCYYISTYAVLALGAADRLVGVEKKANTRPIYSMVSSAIIDLPAVGTMKELSVETVAAQNPDLVILPKKLSGYIEALEVLGLTVLVVNPETDANMREMMTLIGMALNVKSKAQQLLKFYDDKLADFKAPEKKATMLFLGNSSYLTASPAGMYQNDVIALAGGQNSLADNNADSRVTLSYEALLQLNPEYLIIPTGADYKAGTIVADTALKDLDAVKNGKIITFPQSFEEWDSPIPSSILGVLWLRAVLNPTAYSQDSFRKDMTEFYETFYGFTPAKEDIDKLFS